MLTLQDLLFSIHKYSSALKWRIQFNIDFCIPFSSLFDTLNPQITQHVAKFTYMLLKKGKVLKYYEEYFYDFTFRRIKMRFKSKFSL